MDISAILDDRNDKYLEKKYGGTFKAIRESIMSKCNLRFSGKWKIHNANTRNLLFPDFPFISPPPDKEKGKYYPATNTISISDWAISNRYNGEVYRIVIHEILHAHGYDHGPEMTIRENDLLELFIKQNHGLLPFIL